MATTASHTRQVLGDMSVNTPVKATSPTKHAVIKGSTHAQLMSEVAAELKGKRKDAHETPNKRRKIGHVDDRDGEITPSSSFETSGLNDSQNTVITVPDEEGFVSFTNMSPVVAPLNIAQIKAKATSARLRLSLASYKVRTNQIDVPISRLEVRSTSSSLPPLRRTMSNISQRRTALPSVAPSTTPRRSFEHPPSMAYSQFQELAHKAVEGGQEPGRDVGSSPPRLERNGLGEEYSTPILPRQRAGLLNPPLLVGDEGEGDLTSSVVKGRAADGLLSLGRMGRGE